MSTDELVIDEGTGDESMLAPTAQDFRGEILTGSSGDVVPALPDKPVLRLVDSEFKETCESAEKILSRGVYNSGDTLVRVGRALEVRESDSLTEKDRSIGIDGIERNSQQIFLLPVTREFIERELSGLADIQRQKADGSWKRVSCPERLANNILKHGASPHFRPLAGIARAPFIRSDGTICEQFGYDGRSQVLCVPSAEFPDLPAHVSRDDALDALTVLFGPFAEFPFASDSARSAFLCHILTEAARVALDRVPMYFYSASLAGTGKSLLSEMAATIAHGTEPALRDWVDEPEMRKTLFASAVAGDRSIAFDNLPRGHKVRSSTLCKFITTRNSTERILGETRNVSVRSLATVSASGNNLTPAGDLARRSLIVRLDADMTSAELKTRTFAIEDLRSYVLKNRVDMLTAALTILRGHLQSGHKGPNPMQSFEQWSRMVRDAVLWLDMDDPLETQSDEADDETGDLDEAFQQLAARFAERDFLAADISALVNGMIDTSGQLVGALVKAGCVEPHISAKVGYWLRDHRDTIAGGFKLLQEKSGHKGAGKRWTLKPRAPATVIAGESNHLDLLGERA